MCRVDTTVFSTPGWTRQQADACRQPGAWAVGWRGLVWLCLTLWLLVLVTAPAQAREPTVEQLELQRDAEGLVLTARLDMAIPPAVEDALLRGVPLYFAWRAELYRERWYWADKRVGTVVRTMRLAYQPLTRQWRLSLAAEPAANGSSLQYAVHQSFDTLAEARRAITRLVRWRIARGDELESDAHHRVELEFRLDLSLLPRPFQIGLGNQPDWRVEFRRNMLVPRTVAPVIDAPAPEMAGEPVS